MKKIISIFSIIMALFLSACQSSEQHYELGYQNGYNDGFSDGSVLSDIAPTDILDEVDIEDLFLSIAPELEYNAIHYAREYSEWSPEEAMEIIDAYQNGDMYYGTRPISEDDYIDAIRSLYYFYDYFYSSRYE